MKNKSHTSELGLLTARIGAIEVLLQNLYVRYYNEQTSDAYAEALKSLERVKEQNYQLFNSDSDASLEEELKTVQSLLIDFFEHVTSIASMVKFGDHTKKGRARMQDNQFSLEPSHVTEWLQRKLEKKSLQVTQVYSIENASDLVGRVWFQAPEENECEQSCIVKTCGGNERRNKIVEAYHLFDREVFFYSYLAQHEVIAAPKCFYASSDEKCIIMEDLGRYVMGDQESGYEVDEATSVIEKISAFHHYWMDKASELEALPLVNAPSTLSILPQMLETAWLQTKEFLSPLVSGDANQIVEDLIRQIPDYAESLSGKRSTVLHGDLRLENILFDEMSAAGFVDWQLLTKGSPMLDLAYFLTQSGDEERMQKVLDFALRCYADKLAPFGYTMDELKREYKVATHYSLMMPVFGAAWNIAEYGKPRALVENAFCRGVDAYQSLRS